MSNRRKLRKPLPDSFVSRPPTRPATYWNGEQVTADRIRVIVADTTKFPNYWARELVGTERAAVRVVYGDSVFYLDNENGDGWRKVTEGFGTPGWPHKELAIQRVILDG